MLGYCSNSPLRCENARSLRLLDEIDSNCPSCGLFLVPAQKLSHQLSADERLLRIALYVFAILLILVIHLHYTNLI